MSLKLGNSFVEDIARQINEDSRLTQLEKVIIITRILKPPTKEEYLLAEKELDRCRNLKTA